MFGMSGGLALGYFASGCAPGGGSSNMYAYLLGGDVSLSVTMTLISIIASLGNRLVNLLTFYCVHASLHARSSLKLREHDVLWKFNFTRFTTYLQLGTKMNRFDFRLKYQRSYNSMVKKGTLGISKIMESSSFILFP